MADSCIFVLFVLLVVGSNGLFFQRYKSYEDYRMDKRLKSVTTPSEIKIQEMQSGYNKILKSENGPQPWYKSPAGKMIIEALVGCIISWFLGTSFVYLFKCVRNNNKCKPSWFTFKFVGYRGRHQVEESIYEEPIELVVTGPRNPAIA